MTFLNAVRKLYARPRAALSGIVLICALIRIAAVAGMPREYSMLSRDPDMYGHLASRIAAGETYSLPGRGTPTALCPPLYPVVLAPLYAAGIGETDAPLLLYAVIDALACLALYGLVRGLGGTRAAGLLAALGWAVYLPQVSIELRLWTEPLAALLTTAALWALAAASLRGGARRYLLGGVLLGLATLTRSTMLPLALLAAIAAALASAGGPRERFGRAALVITACAAVMTPWTIRNAVAFDAFVPTTTHGGQSLYEGNCGLEDEDFLRNIHIPESRERFARLLAERDGISFGELPEPERDRLYREEALRIIGRHPGRYAILSLNRFARLWFNVGYKGEPPSRRSLALFGLHLALLAAFVAGLRRGGRDRMRAFAPALAVVAGTTLLHMATIAYARYVFPVIPAVIAVTVVSWSTARDDHQGRSHSTGGRS